jgi:hypothetical protein
MVSVWTCVLYSLSLYVYAHILHYRDMSNNEAEKDEMKDEAHELQDDEQDEQDSENENDADFQEE